MRQISIFNLIILLFSLFSGQAALASSDGNNITSPDQANSLSSQIKIRVVQPPAPVDVVFAAPNNAVSFTCQTSAAQSATFVQDTGLVNLYQPADCFSLQVSAPAAAMRELKVGGLHAAPAKISVLIPKLEISSPQFAPTPLAPFSQPLLPLIPFAVVVALFIFERRVAAGFLSSIKITKPSLSMPRLMVLRC